MEDIGTYATLVTVTSKQVGTNFDSTGYNYLHCVFQITTTGGGLFKARITIPRNIANENAYETLTINNNSDLGVMVFFVLSPSYIYIQDVVGTTISGFALTVFGIK